MTGRSIALLTWLSLTVLSLGCERSTPEDPANLSAEPTAAVESLAVRAHEVPGIEVTLLGVRHSQGDTVTIRWRYRNTTPEAKRLSPNANAPEELADMVTRAILVDEANGKKYYVLRDADDRPVLSRVGGAAWPILQPGESVDVSAHFPAPSGLPAQLSFYVPGSDPFEPVTITE